MFEEIYNLLNRIKEKETITCSDIIEIETKIKKLEKRCVVWSEEDIEDFFAENFPELDALNSSQINSILDEIFWDYDSERGITIDVIYEHVNNFLKRNGIVCD